MASSRGTFKRPGDEALLADLRLVVNQGLLLGNERFKEEVASIVECNTHSRSRPGKK